MICKKLYRHTYSAWQSLRQSQDMVRRRNAFRNRCAGTGRCYSCMTAMPTMGGAIGPPKATSRDPGSTSGPWFEYHNIWEMAQTVKLPNLRVELYYSLSRERVEFPELEKCRTQPILMSVAGEPLHNGSCTVVRAFLRGFSAWKPVTSKYGLLCGLPKPIVALSY